MPDTPDIAAMTAERIRVLDAEIARLTEERERLQHSLNILQGLTEAKHFVRPNDMAMPITASDSSQKREKTGLSSACREVGIHGLRELADLVAKHPLVAGKGIGCSYGTISAAANGNQPINRLVCEAIQDLTKHAEIKADKLRGREAIPASKGFAATKANWPKIFG